MPPAGWVLPPALSKFSLWYNYIYGTLPADWKLPKGLTHLDVGGWSSQLLFLFLIRREHSIHLTWGCLRGPDLCSPTWQPQHNSHAS